ncbi:MAG: aspartate/tyrosine/aromatic aminotransferase [Parachlamydiaceae bacterium]|nr:aspartate/tyrosine/aromatic aminotransferase [Parachlamydiaceae bacterium]
MSFFETLDLLSDDPIFSIPSLCAADSRLNKVDLSLGVYYDEKGRLTVLQCIRQAEEILLKQQLDKKYQPMDGNPEFIKQTLKLIFGENASLNEIYGAQTLGGTGALRVAGEFLRKSVGSEIFLPEPTWANHKLIFSHTDLNLNSFNYFNDETKSLEFEKICSAIQKMPSRSLIVLQTCCHNPTGVDPTPTQWKEFSRLILKHQIFPIFDFAYQGFGQDLEKDAAPIRLFHSEGHNMAVAYSFSKNLGLYGERVGLLALSEPDKNIRNCISSHIKRLIRSNYSTPPLHGSRLAATVLTSPNLRKVWIDELDAMRTRISSMRKALMDGLYDTCTGTGTNYSFLGKQKGLFSFCGLSPAQVTYLQKEFAIYMPSNGRINIANLNPSNIDYVTKALRAAFQA